MKETFAKIDLPTKGVPYPGVDAIELKPLNVLQIKRMFSLGVEGVGDKIYDILNGSIKGIKIQELTVGDFWFVMHWIRFNTFSAHPIRIPWTCPHCETENNTVLDNSLIEINDLEEDYKPGKMKIKMIDHPDPLHFRLQVIGDETAAADQLTDYIRQKKRLKSTAKVTLTEGDLWNAVLAMIIEPNGGTFEERYELVSTLSPDDLFRIQSIADVYTHGVGDVIKLTCANPDCGQESEVRYSLNIRNFFPRTGDRDSVETTRSAISSDD